MFLYISANNYLSGAPTRGARLCPPYPDVLTKFWEPEAHMPMYHLLLVFLNLSHHVICIDIEQDFQMQIIEKSHFCCKKSDPMPVCLTGLKWVSKFERVACCFIVFSTGVPFVHVCGMSWEECAVDFQSQQLKAGIYQLSASKLRKPRWATTAAHWESLQK